jgi:predicted ATPase
LFVEKLTKAVLENGDRDNRVAAVLTASPLPGLAIPATLHASLIARLDRLGLIAKEVVQIGAVVGREFGYDLIERVARRPGAELKAGLDRLAGSRLLFCRGIAPHSSYLFKHALVQDAAYGTCCAPVGKNCTRGSRRCSNSFSPISSNASPNFWPII